MSPPNNTNDCDRCKTSIYNYVRDIKSDLKEIVSERSKAVSDHLTDLVKQVNKSLDSGSARMDRIQGEVDSVAKQVSTYKQSESNKDDQRRNFTYKLIMWMIGLGLVYTFTIYQIISGSHQRLEQDIERTREIHRNSMYDHILDCQRVKSDLAHLKEKIKRLER